MYTLKSCEFTPNDSLRIVVKHGEGEIVAHVPGRVVGPAFRPHLTSIQETCAALLAALNEATAEPPPAPKKRAA